MLTKSTRGDGFGRGCGLDEETQLPENSISIHYYILTVLGTSNLVGTHPSAYSAASWSCHVSLGLLELGNWRAHNPMFPREVDM